MSNKKALINARVANFKQQDCPTQNILLEKGQVIGLGYLPDEESDEIQVYDLNGSVIIPNPFSIEMTPQMYTEEECLQLGYQSQIISQPGLIEKEALITFYQKNFKGEGCPLYVCGPKNIAPF